MEYKETSVLELGYAIHLSVNLHLLCFSLLCLFLINIIQGKRSLPLYVTIITGQFQLYNEKINYKQSFYTEIDNITTFLNNKQL